MSAYRPGEVAPKLGIAAPTLRRWSVQFAEFLSAGASAAIAPEGGALERRYTTDDIALLQRASALLKEGLTYEQVRQQFTEEPVPQEQPAPLTVIPDAARALVEVATVQRETIAAQKETIAYLKAEVERLRAEQERQRERYLSIIQKLLARMQ